MQQISSVLANQFNSVWTMLEKTITNIPDEKWNQGVGEWFFSLTAYHVVETAEFYTRENPEGMIWGGRAGFSWDSEENRTRCVAKNHKGTSHLLSEGCTI